MLRRCTSKYPDPATGFRCPVSKRKPGLGQSRNTDRSTCWKSTGTHAEAGAFPDSPSVRPLEIVRYTGAIERAHHAANTSTQGTRRHKRSELSTPRGTCIQHLTVVLPRCSAPEQDFRGRRDRRLLCNQLSKQATLADHH